MNNPAIWKTWAGACACFLAVSLSAAQRVVKTAEEAQAAGRAAGIGAGAEPFPAGPEVE